ncbi:14839_t:CDS:2 [Gigaspora margarita]|uniref:14839_t:CDS:1 n=1 Tax=Gigaspora margarita TaxID=4874 RepID=A0ABN7VHE5_GIGMA|nr:14839_t:CDS:2 [Gigaspora margarita]
MNKGEENKLEVPLEEKVLCRVCESQLGGKKEKSSRIVLELF